MSSVELVLDKLKSKARSDQVEGMARFGMTAENRLGVSVPDMRKIAKEIGRNHVLALDLWNTGIPEARIVAGMIAEPEVLTEKQMDDWVKDFNSWDVCDQVCMNLFDKSPFAWQKVLDWAERYEEFVRRAAFSLLACLAWHDKDSSDEKFMRYFSLIKDVSVDGRNFVKKAVNWSLRTIGKRNINLNKAAIEVARDIQKIDSKSARWIANDALRELESEAIQKRLRE